MKSNPDKTDASPLLMDKLRGYCSLSHRIQEYASVGTSRSSFMDSTSRLILKYFCCQSVELWLTDGDLRYRWKNTKDNDNENDFEVFDQEQSKDSESPQEGTREFPGRLPLEYLENKKPSLTPMVICEGKINLINGNQNNLPASPGVLSSPLPCPGGPVVFLPLSLKNQDRGLMLLTFDRDRELCEEDLELMIQVSRTIGIAISNRRSRSALGERVKELSCLYDICKLFKRPGISLPFILRHVVRLLPPAMQFPGIAHGRITFDGKIYETPKIPKDHLSLTSDISIHGVERGKVEVIYPENHPDFEFGVFLQEERHLLDSVARQVSLIIERTQAEKEKLRLERQLRHADQLATIGQLASGVAHELNEPLSSILGFAQLARNCPDIPPQAGSDLDRILKASLHAREIVRKLLIYARQMPVTKSSVNLNQVLDDVIPFFEHRLAKERIQLVTHLQDDLPHLVADLPQVRQVILNLLVNAIQAMPGGGSLVVHTGTEGGRVILTVEDTGIGMDEKVIKRIFDPFFTTKEVGKGTGLGLAVVHGIMTSHGGNITVESEKDLGTTFRVSFPGEESQITKGEKIVD